MTIRGQHGKHHLYFHTVLVFTVLAVIFTTALTAAGLSGDQTGKHQFELRLASHEKVEGWERVPGPGPENDSRMDLARSCSDQPRRSPRLPHPDT